MERRKLFANAAGFLSLIQRQRNTAGLSLKKFSFKKLILVSKTSLFLFLAVPFSLVIAGMFFWWMFFWWGYNLQPVDRNSREKISFVINKGDGLSKISENLKNKGLIKSSFHFRIYCLLRGTAKKIKAGNYYLSFSMSPWEICRDLVKGVNDEWVTIIEGLRSEQIGRIFTEKGFEINLVEWEEQVKNRGLEGRLFPDSYLIPRGADQERILQIINQNFQKKVLGNLVLEIQKSGMEINEILTLASIIEREAKTDSDRGIIAGILIKRIENDWSLQVDASVQYAVGSKNCSILKSPCEWWPQVTSNDLKINSQYNTYLHKGLLPAPICNPGLSSIGAVLQPKKTDYWFYISDQNGIMHYAKTGEEHHTNVEK